MLRISKISFPGLGIGEFSVNSEAVSIGSFSIAWYGVIITLGMIFAVSYIIYKSKSIGMTMEDVLDYAIFVIPFGVLGARIYYVLMEIESYHSLRDMLDITQGGLAIYGGIIAGTITVMVISRIKGISFPAFGDCVVPGLIMAQSIGRWGNFMNGEAYGGLTENFLRMGLYNINTVSDFGSSEMVYVHPTFLYESLWNLVGFVLINIFFKHKKYDGQIILLIFGWYGLGRLWIEGLRTDSLYIFGIVRVSQLLAGIAFLGCLSALIYFAIKPPKAELYFKTSDVKEKK